jgi:hypothetical protein
VEKYSNRMPPNLLADYLYLWEAAVEQLALLSRKADTRRVTGAGSVNCVALPLNGLPPYCSG